MDKITKIFNEKWDSKSAYQKLLTRKYPDLSLVDADAKVIKNAGQITDPSVLAETPIDQFQTIGDFSKGSSFTRKADRAILSNPKAVEKIKDKFSGVEQTFDMYFVNTKEGRKYSEVGEVEENFIRNELKLDTPINRNNITVFYTNNKGDEGVMKIRFNHNVL